MPADAVAGLGHPGITLVDVSSSAKAILLQFKDVVGVVEWLLDQSETHWTNASERVRV